VLSIIAGFSLILVGSSRSLPLTCLGMFIVGGANIIMIALFNISVQLAAPRWVTARALSLFSSALTGGIAIGAVIWGLVASRWSVDIAVIASGIVLLILPILGILLPLPQSSEADVELVELDNVRGPWCSKLNMMLIRPKPATFMTRC
jgi:predicted MFS family arabinose efflux permease